MGKKYTAQQKADRALISYYHKRAGFKEFVPSVSEFNRATHKDGTPSKLQAKLLNQLRIIDRIPNMGRKARRKIMTGDDKLKLGTAVMTIQRLSGQFQINDTKRLTRRYNFGIQVDNAVAKYAEEAVKKNITNRFMGQQHGQYNTAKQRLRNPKPTARNYGELYSDQFSKTSPARYRRLNNAHQRDLKQEIAELNATINNPRTGKRAFSKAIKELERAESQANITFEPISSDEDVSAMDTLRDGHDYEYYMKGDVVIVYDANAPSITGGAGKLVGVFYTSDPNTIQLIRTSHIKRNVEREAELNPGDEYSNFAFLFN